MDPSRAPPVAPLQAHQERDFACASASTTTTSSARLPPEDMGYRHVGSLVYYERDGARRHDEPQYSRQEAIRDRLERAKEGPPDGMQDHRVPRYEALARRWRED